MGMSWRLSYPVASESLLPASRDRARRQTPHHLAGVKPDVSITPTVAGLRAGRDEVLDRAVALIRGQ